MHLSQVPSAFALSVDEPDENDDDVDDDDDPDDGQYGLDS